MMKDAQNTYDLYHPLPEHTIKNVQTTSSGHKVTVQHLFTGETKELHVSFCAILIGSRPDLRFLSHMVQQPVDGKENRCPALDEVIQREMGDGIEPNNKQHWGLVGKKISWLKNLCAKCRHLNLCEWSRRNHYSNNSGNGQRNANELMALKKQCCRQSQLRQCECNGVRPTTECKMVTLENCAYDSDTKSIIGLGEDVDKPIDCKTNPVAVGKFTNEMLHTPKGLYSMGPLVGDNFIRFIPGGALAITAALHKEND